MNCINCSSVLSQDDSQDTLIGTNGSSYGPCCNTCWGFARICDNCSSIFSSDSPGIIAGEHGHFCQTCAESVSSCSCCGRIVEGGSLTDIGSLGKICQSCKDLKYFFCSSCGKYHMNVDSIENNKLTQLRFPGLWKAYKAGRVTGTKSCIPCFVSLRTTHREHRVFSCKRCGELSNNVMEAADDGGSLLDYCHKCEGYVFKCKVCSSYHTEGSFVTSLGGKVCLACMVNFSYCNSCNSTVHNSHFNAEEGMCKECFSLVIKCQSCGRNTVSTHNIGGKVVCPDCHRKSGRCDVCSCVSLKLYTYENAGGKYCRKCASSRLLGRAESYSFKPYAIMHGKKADLFMGFENEISVRSGESIPVNIAKVLNHYSEDQLYIKSDSSVSHGFEEVSHPFTFEELKKVNWEYLFTTQTIKHNSCGFHVHLNRSAFTTLHMYKFISFIHNNEVFIEKLAGRKANSYARNLQYTPKEGAKVKLGWDRYNKVNLNPRATIELRFFAGCADLYHLMYRLEFCHALYIFSKNNSEKGMGVDSFISFVQKSQRDYPYLSDYLSA